MVDVVPCYVTVEHAMDRPTENHYEDYKQILHHTCEGLLSRCNYQLQVTMLIFLPITSSETYCFS